MRTLTALPGSVISCTRAAPAVTAATRRQALEETTGIPRRSPSSEPRLMMI